MRLEKIKLAGFKSFVEPTVVLLPSNLVAVVGPNGCGKSNVIDAVRWVMGESSARLLRGESMADVIFNGSNSRKSVDQARVELIFDNSAGGIKGRYANCSEIAIKRVVSRDGQSTYFLNSVRCRRRDITDLFLGTGLGPRSYSIIEQGMISRLIEARPEDLRAFLEEAAGISKYKERRKETEAHIRTTRENLDRLNDLREEVLKRLRHIQRQATAAEQYQALRAEEQQRKGQLLAVRWRSLAQEQTVQAAHIAELEIKVTATLDQQSLLDTRLTEQRAQQNVITEQVHAIQTRYHTLETLIARKEQTLKFHYESHTRVQKELAQLATERAALETQAQQITTELGALVATLAIQESELEQLMVEAETRNQILDEAETAMQLWQLDWDSFNHTAAEATQVAEVERTRINHLDQQNLALEQRLTKLHDELHSLNPLPLQTELATLIALEQAQQQQVLEHNALLEETVLSIQTLRTTQIAHTQLKDATRDALHSARNRQSSLEALQQAKLGHTPDTLKQWLVTQGLDRAELLAERLEVTPQWRYAVETVLGATLGAYCVASLEQYTTALEHLTTGPLQLFETGGTLASTPGNLQQEVQAPWSVSSLLGTVDTAPTLTVALQDRHSLAPHQSLITPNGTRIGRNWLSIPGTASTEQGVLERTATLKMLGSHIDELVTQLTAVDGKLKYYQHELMQAEQIRDTTQATSNLLIKDLAHTQSTLSGLQASLDHLLHRRATVLQEVTELTRQLTDAREAAAVAQERLYTALDATESLSQQREALTLKREQLRSNLEELRIRTKTIQEQARDLNAHIETIRIKHATHLSTEVQLQAQLVQNAQRSVAVIASTPESVAIGELSAELEKLIAERAVLADELQTAKAQLATLDASKQTSEHTRQQLEKTLRTQHTALEKERVTSQDVLIRIRTLEEQLKDGKHVVEELLATLPDVIDYQQLEADLAHCSAKLERLGPINLAAIDELRAETERKDYLDAQYTDISQALDALEETMQRIDRETKTRFKETFDKINAGLHTLFPQLFGGGQAYLELTGEDLLDAGVTIMARPPGKRNSNIHMLSGGEKALTAVAMVFAIFQLNPAPFCMLDEVDAPLDDANVGRFCDLVASMAEQVQFIFITHNKITMELAKQLIGVTMHEPGVSRLVTVDIDEAIKFAVAS